MFVAKLKSYLFGSIFRRGATLLTVLTLGSYMLGLVRDILFARFFGASRLLDIYNSAFIIPDLLLNIFVAGALTAAFVPVFSHLYATGEREEAEKVATTVLYAAPVTILIIGIPIFIFMPFLDTLVAPGFVGQEKQLLVTMSRLLLLSPIIFATSNTLGNTLISLEKFGAYGISPVLYNLGIIVGIPLVSVFGPLGLVVGVIVGALLHLTIRVVGLIRGGFKLRYPIDLGNRNFLKIPKLMIPRMAGQPIEQIIFFIFNNLASTLAVGSIAVLSFARNFQSVPVSLFGISFSTAIFASLSRKAALGDRVGFMRHLKEAAGVLAIMSGLSAIIFLIFGEQIIRLFLGGGRFSEEDVVRTGKLLMIFALAVPAESFIHLIARSFYAMKDTWTPVLVSLPGLIFIAFLAKFLIPSMSLNALPFSYFVGFTVEALLLTFLLRKKLQKL